MIVNISTHNMALHVKQRAYIEDKTRLTLGRFAHLFDEVSISLIAQSDSFDDQDVICIIAINLNTGAKQKIEIRGNNLDDALGAGISRIRRNLNRYKKNMLEGHNSAPSADK